MVNRNKVKKKINKEKQEINKEKEEIFTIEERKTSEHIYKYYIDNILNQKKYILVYGDIDYKHPVIISMQKFRNDTFLEF